MKKYLILSVVALGYQAASAQSLLETFGSGSDQFEMEFVTIGNPNNPADTTGSPNPVGSVAYTYNLGKYEVSRDQIDKANAAGSLGITMFDMTNYGGNGLLKPATGVSWYEAAKFVNWLNTSTGNTVAYKFDGSGNFQLWSSTDAGYNANNLFRNSLAKYWLPSSDEWYKGAYGNPNGSWSKFPNGSDSAPAAVAGGTDANTAVYDQSLSTGPADITNAGGLSPYGTMAQAGNVREWNETAWNAPNDTVGEGRLLRGGSWNFSSSYLDARLLQFLGPSVENSSPFSPLDNNGNFGFRVASAPEPSSLSLLPLGGVVVALRRRKRV